ncbi:hypothetical protein BH10PSE2_BH10PSE2_02860 [soil metagenome]
MRRTTPLILVPALLAFGLMLSGCGDAAPAAPARTDAAAVTTAPNTVMPEDAPPQEEADASMADSNAAAANDGSGGPCTGDIGQDASARLVQRCLAVSPATHPPCNAQNTCALIQDEIDRSCAQYGPDEKKPDECAA